MAEPVSDSREQVQGRAGDLRADDLESLADVIDLGLVNDSGQSATHASNSPACFR